MVEVVVSPAQPAASRGPAGLLYGAAVLVLVLAAGPALTKLPGPHGLGAGAWHAAVAAVHAATLAALVALAARRSGRERLAGALGLGLLAAWVAVDARCYALIGRHLLAGGGAVLGAEGRELFQVGPGDLGEVLLCALAAAVVGGRLGRVAPRARALAGLLALDLALTLAGGGLRFYGVRPLLGTARALPLAPAPDLRRPLAWLTGQPPQAIDQDPSFPEPDPSQLEFRTVRAHPWPAGAARRPDVLVLVAAGLRADALAWMPRLSALAGRSFRAEHHLSSGNCGELGAFSLLSGLPPTFWTADAAWRAPRGLGALSALGYRLDLVLGQGVPMRAVKRVAPPWGETDVWADERRISAPERDRATLAWARRWLAEAPGQPRLAVLSLAELTLPYDAPGLPPLGGALRGDSWDLRAWAGPLHARYAAAAAALDTQLGPLLADLEARPGTAVIVTGAYGEAFGEHGVLGHSSRLDPEQLRVPLLMRLPGEPPRSYPGLSSHQDVLPTLLGYLGVPPPESGAGQGRDLRAPDSGEAPPVVAACGYAGPEGDALVLDGLRLDFLQDRRGAHLIAASTWDGVPAEPPADAQERLDRAVDGYRSLLEPSRAR